MKCCCGNCEYYKFDWEQEEQEEQEEQGLEPLLVYYCDNEWSENYHKQTDSDHICGQWEAE